ncbi:hypothetical protein EUU23_04470 [Sphingorhabdus sp. IMCC26285]|uniref:Ribbon-helix-helix protein, CopG family n=1 Tax=Sphingorhabdus profundilacus TaxID=2509718 RepID=A0A6I4LVS3_9SPHN|nr:hypothetical protein [Sphingorhabdus profundilacus]MVZ96959.1 hypothetical protein [Sphingorhabdus profundilacus]
MQTERVTYLTSAEQKAALEAFAKARGESVGNVLREATVRYMAQPTEPNEEEEALKLLAKELNEAAPRIQASLDRTHAKMVALHEEMDAFFAEKGIR